LLSRIDTVSAEECEFEFEFELRLVVEFFFESREGDREGTTEVAAEVSAEKWRSGEHDREDADEEEEVGGVGGRPAMIARARALGSRSDRGRRQRIAVDRLEAGDPSPRAWCGRESGPRRVVEVEVGNV
jgi:hypothetical protein